AFDALRRADLVNLLVVPGDPDPEVLVEAMTLAAARGAVLLRDPPVAWATVSAAVSGAASPTFPRRPDAAVYFPRIRQPGPLRGPAGAVAGVIARSDLTRGVWRSPAGLEANLDGVEELEVAVNDVDGGRLNPLGVNCIRAFPGTGPVVWGARTTDAGDWKYLTVRRTALFVQESLGRGTGWARFEPNEEPLWARIRADAGAFMEDLFRRGAFAGTTPGDAWFVRCDGETTTQDDVDRGLVNIVVGFAPTRPAEFVVLHLQQVAGQATPPP
ncbi:MAG TPA: phage tail sheath C-terminal domain-containing protein, partial [Acidimicrobiales bacterium]|nr:phage tail sheath C-terminal domain-containing protein [Acidimicrobiales bacterium]